MPGRSSPSRLSIRTSTGNIVTFCSITAWGSILSTVPSNGRLGYASTVTVARWPGLDLADVGLVHQRAHLHQVEVGHLEQHRAAADVAGGRGDHLAALDVLLDDGAGDRRADVGVLELDLARSPPPPGADHVGAWRWRSRAAPVSCSCSVIDWVLNSSSARRFCDVALVELRLGHLEVGLGLGHRVPRRAGVDPHQRASPRLTSWPVSTCRSRISPEALDFTSTTVSGWTVPDAWADTTMSRRSTGSAW